VTHAPVTISTIGDLIDHRMSMHVHCKTQDCGNSGPVDLDKLALKLGRDHGCLADELRPHFKCSRCGKKNMGFTMSGYDVENFKDKQMLRREP